jgi:hypothetical protein
MVQRAGGWNRGQVCYGHPPRPLETHDATIAPKFQFLKSWYLQTTIFFKIPHSGCKWMVYANKHTLVVP